MPSIGPLEIAVILVVALIVFGPKRLPELGRSMGKGIREFKGSLDLDASATPGEVEERVPARQTTEASPEGTIRQCPRHPQMERSSPSRT